MPRFLVRQFEEIVEQAKLVQHFERGRMNGVATKVAQEIRVLLEDRHFDPGARQEKTEHHSGGSAAGDAAGSDQFARTVVTDHELPVLCSPNERSAVYEGRVSNPPSRRPATSGWLPRMSFALPALPVAPSRMRATRNSSRSPARSAVRINSH